MKMNTILKSVLLSMILVLGAMNSFAQSQEQTDGSRFLIQPNIGYTSYNLSDVKNFYEDVLAIYSDSGIPIPTQQEYNPSLVMGLAALYKIPIGTSFGLGSQYSKATALSSYEDYAGSLKVSSKVSFITLEGIIQHDFRSRSKYNFFAAIRGGFAFINAEYKHDILFYDLPEQSGNISLTGSGIGYTVEGMMGIKRTLNKLDLIATAGYRKTSVSELDATLEATGQITSNETMSITHDLSGVALNLLIAYKF